MSRSSYLYWSLAASVCLHLLLLLPLGLVPSFSKKPPERYIEVVPYEPKYDRGMAAPPPPDTRSLGPRNFTGRKQEAPKGTPGLPPRGIYQAPASPPVQPAFRQPAPPAPPQEDRAGDQQAAQQKQGGGPVRQGEQLLTSKNQDGAGGFSVSQGAGRQESGKEGQGKPSSSSGISLSKLVPRTSDLMSRMPKEATVDLNSGGVKSGKEFVVDTKEFKYWSYLDKMKRKVEAVWHYPEQALAGRISGSLKMDFTIGKDGKMVSYRITESSGYRFLDEAAVAAIRDGAPFAPFPSTWDIDVLNVKGTFIYHLTGVR